MSCLYKDMQLGDQARSTSQPFSSLAPQHCFLLQASPAVSKDSTAICFLQQQYRLLVQVLPFPCWVAGSYFADAAEYMGRLGEKLGRPSVSRLFSLPVPGVW